MARSPSTSPEIVGWEKGARLHVRRAPNYTRVSLQKNNEPPARLVHTRTRSLHASASGIASPRAMRNACLVWNIQMHECVAERNWCEKVGSWFAQLATGVHERCTRACAKKYCKMITRDSAKTRNCSAEHLGDVCRQETFAEHLSSAFRRDSRSDTQLDAARQGDSLAFRRCCAFAFEHLYLQAVTRVSSPSLHEHGNVIAYQLHLAAKRSQN